MFHLNCIFHREYGVSIMINILPYIYPVCLMLFDESLLYFIKCLGTSDKFILKICGSVGGFPNLFD